MDPFWRHVVIAAAIFLLVSLFARLLDWSLQRRPLPPEAVTRYRIFRRTLTVIILAVGLFSALLAIPEVRAVAGGLLEVADAYHATVKVEEDLAGGLRRFRHVPSFPLGPASRWLGLDSF